MKKVLKHVFSIVFSIVFCVILIGCTSMPEPKNESQSLVVGIISIQAIHALSNLGGVEITFRSIERSMDYVLRTSSDGLFFSNNLPNGSYEITRIRYPNRAGGNRIITINNPRFLQIDSGKVYNLGHILYIGNNEGTSGRFSWNREYKEVYDLFQEKYHVSEWNRREWINFELSTSN